MEGSRALAHFWSEKIGFLFFFRACNLCAFSWGSWINRNLFGAVILVIYVPIVNCIMKIRESERASERKNIAEIDELKTRDNQESPTYMQSTKTRSYICMQHTEEDPWNIANENHLDTCFTYVNNFYLRHSLNPSVQSNWINVWMFEHAERTGCMFTFLHDCQLYLANRFATVKRDTLCNIGCVWVRAEQSRANVDQIYKIRIQSYWNYGNKCNQYRRDRVLWLIYSILNRFDLRNTWLDFLT